MSLAPLPVRGKPTYTSAGKPLKPISIVSDLVHRWQQGTGAVARLWRAKQSCFLHEGRK